MKVKAGLIRYFRSLKNKTEYAPKAEIKTIKLNCKNINNKREIKSISESTFMISMKINKMIIVGS